MYVFVIPFAGFGDCSSPKVYNETKVFCNPGKFLPDAVFSLIKLDIYVQENLNNLDIW